ncbi:putative metal-dependent hydrolase YabD [Candidatus Saccharibacteria bacterium]|nr:putative metal-dependent hydrolase YabD [Candidatus Saccharibacteria bacterium]
MLVDTHAHIHIEEFKNDLDEIFESASKSDVKKIITVGTDEVDSKEALEFCYRNNHETVDVFASAGIHPHDADRGNDSLLTLKELVIDGGYSDKLVAIGECGLDYFRNNSDKKSQQTALDFQLQLSQDSGLPVIFHVRDAWDDFFGILKNFKNTRGVIHSFTGTSREVELASKNNLYFGINGIITFTKISEQLDAVKKIPTDKLLFETDCPYLSPEPLRGRRNEPANIKIIAEFVSKLRNESLKEISKSTTTNARTLFGLK